MLFIFSLISFCESCHFLLEFLSSDEDLGRGGIRVPATRAEFFKQQQFVASGKKAYNMSTHQMKL
jgi:hypothetical protein